MRLIALLLISKNNLYITFFRNSTFMTAPRVYKYKAFISYRHQDEAQAVALQEFLEKFRLPVKLCKQYPDRPKRLGNIFRDATDLPPQELRQAISKALAVSEYMIVLCSQWTNLPNKEGKRWVQEEVEEFLSLNEQNKYKIIPVLLPREDVSVDKEYMPKALVDLDIDILATDMVKKEPKTCYYDVVASLLNLDPVDLRNRAEEAERKQRFRKKLLTWSCSIIALCAGVFAWDFCVPKVSYFRDYVECYNVPHGIHELTEEEISGLTIHYRFTEQFYKVQMVERCNSAGYKTDFNYPWAKGRPVAMKYTYDYLRNRVTTCDYLNKQGRVVASLRYPENDPNFEKVAFIVKDGAGVEKGSGFVAPLISRNMGLGNLEFSSYPIESEIVQMKLVRDKNGRVVMEKFLDYKGELCKNQDGFFGYKYEYDDIGRLIKMRFMSINWQNKPNKQGIMGFDVSYKDFQEMPTSLKYVKKESDVAGLNDVAGECYVWEKGNIKQVFFCDYKGNPILHKDGYFSVVYEYNEKGYLDLYLFVDINGRPCVNYSDGIVCSKYEYNKKGEAEKIIFLGIDKNPIMCNFGFAGLENEYDGQGNVIKVIYLGVDRKPCKTSMGYTEIRYEYNTQGQKTKESYYDEKGNYITTIDYTK